MSFRLNNAPTVFMDFINCVFSSFLDYIVIVFMDDILMYSRRREEHMQHLRFVVKNLREHRLFTKF